MRTEASATPSSPDRKTGISNAWRALRWRNFRLYFSGQTISLIGTWMTRLATSWLVYRLTGSALLLGIVGFSGQIPTFLFAPFAGVWVDRLDRRRVLVVTQALAMLQSLALAALTLSRHINIQEIIWLSAFQGLINAFDMPARQAFLVQMVEDKQDLGNAIALNSSMVNLARLVGPSLAGAVIAVSGEGACFLIDGISYIAVIASLLAMRLAAAPPKPTVDSMLSQLKEGWAYVSGFAPVRTILLLFAMVSLMGWPFTVLMPIFAGKILHGGPHTLGFLMGAVGVGALVSAMSLALRKTVLGLGRMIPLSTAALGAGLILFGMSRILWVSLMLMLVCGFGMMQQMAASNTIIQTIVEDNKRGRVMSFYAMAFVGMAPFGSLLAGVLAHAIGAPRTVMLSGACCIAGAAWFAKQLRAIRKLIRPIYVDLGILPGVNAVIRDSLGG
ncbi:MAG: MFS transporter [Terriglobales bacterium]